MIALEEFSVLRKYSTNEASFPKVCGKEAPRKGIVEVGKWNGKREIGLLGIEQRRD
jgi:hypothetical protein